MCLWVCACVLRWLRRPEALCTWSWSYYEPPLWVLGTELGPLQEQEVLFKTFKKLTNKLANQPTSQPANQPANQSTNQPTHGKI